MNSNLRFAFLIIGVVCLLVLVWNLLDGGGDEPQETGPEPISVKNVSETGDTSSSWDAPEERSIDSILSQRNRNRPRPSQTKTSVDTQNEPDKASESETVDEGKTIGGRVTNKAGQSVEGALVRVYTYGGQQDTKTDSDGRYSFVVLNDQNSSSPQYSSYDGDEGYGYYNDDDEDYGYYDGYSSGAKQAAQGSQVHVNHPDYNDASKSNVAPGSTDVDFVLTDLGSIAGRVVNADSGDPITEFEVVHLRGNNQLVINWQRESPKHVSSLEGSFTLSDIKSGENTVLAQAEGYMQGFRLVKLGETETANVVIRLKPGAALKGKVLTQRGTPVPDASLFLERLPARADERFKETVETTDAAGTFALAALPPKGRWIWASHPDYAPGFARYDQERPAPVTITLGNGGILRGRVTVDGRAVEGAGIGIECSSIEKAARSGQDGTWEFTRLTAGTVTVYAGIDEMGTSPKRKFMQVARIIDGETTEVNFDVSSLSAVVEGRVLIDGLPPASGIMKVIMESLAGLERDFADSSTDENGYYRFEALPQGTATLRAAVKDPDGRERRKSVTIQTVSEGTVVRDIEFGATGSITATLAGTYADETPIVILLDGELRFPDDLSEDWIESYIEFLARGELKPDQEGLFKSENIEVGVYTLWGTGFRENSEGIDRLPDLRVTTAFVEVQAGTETRIDLVLK